MTEDTAVTGLDTGHRHASCPRGCASHGTDRLFTSASIITMVRTVVCVGLAMAAFAGHGQSLLLVALIVHWVADSADGIVARLRDEETITGAVLDITADRVVVAAIYLGFVAQRPEFAWALGVYLVEFMFVDAALSLAFLRWPISGPDFFHLVDRLIWRLNWFRPAKAVNSALVAVLCVLVGSPALALAVAVALLILKSLCLVRVSGALTQRGEVCAGHPT